MFICVCGRSKLGSNRLVLSFRKGRLWAQGEWKEMTKVHPRRCVRLAFFNDGNWNCMMLLRLLTSSSANPRLHGWIVKIVTWNGVSYAVGCDVNLFPVAPIAHGIVLICSAVVARVGHVAALRKISRITGNVKIGNQTFPRVLCVCCNFRMHEK